MFDSVLSLLQDWGALVLGTEAGRGAISPFQMVARAAIIYIATVLLLRLGQKRSLSDATAFDVVLGIIIGSIAGRAVTGSAPLMATVAAMAALIGLHWLTSALALRSTAFSRFVKGAPNKLIHDGSVDWSALKAVHMTQDDLEEELREKGVDHPRKAKAAWLERSGRLSVIKRRQGP
jgi:uncharacterized membrane protein YcaP (DUF421 family)